MPAIAENYGRLRAAIAEAAERAGRAADEITLVGISKTVGAEQVRAAHAAGLCSFGENRAQELAAKREALADLPIAWHFVGHLQTNKVRLVVPGCQLIHSVDGIDLARRIDERASAEAPQRVLVQVNTSGETSKSGVSPGELSALLDGIAALPHLIVAGLMTIGPLTADTGAVRAAFHDLRTAIERERAAGRPRAPLDQLSMGMSGDFAIAIAEGATLVRIGTALFGPRG
jgi:pyridoxal phosphate enzyme (YggS family)